MANIGVLGAGSWGTALSVLLHDNGNQATIWSIDPAEIEMLSKEREHKTKLPGVHISEEIQITGEIQEAILGKDFLVLAVPSPFTRATAKKMSSRANNRGCGKRDRRDHIDDTFRADQRRDSAGGCSSSFRTEPRGRGRKKAADNLCDRCDDKKDG